MSKPMICTHCFTLTTQEAANDRNYHTGKCGRCGGELKEHLHIEERSDLVLSHRPNSNGIDFDDPKAPTQAQFNEYHKEPIDYGEDGDQLLGMQYTKEQAVEIFKKHWEMLTGETADIDFENSVISGRAGWSEDPDIDGGDYCFVMLNSGNTDTKPRYEAWRLWV